MEKDLITKSLKRSWNAIKDNNIKFFKDKFLKYKENSEEESSQENHSTSSLCNCGTGRRGFVKLDEEHGSFSLLFNYSALWTIGRGRYEILSFLLELDIINFRFQNSDGSFLLYELCRKNQYTQGEAYSDVLNQFITKGGNINERNIIENCPLHIAAITGNTVAVKMLLDAGAFTNSINM